MDSRHELMVHAAGEVTEAYLCINLYYRKKHNRYSAKEYTYTYIQTVQMHVVEHTWQMPHCYLLFCWDLPRVVNYHTYQHVVLRSYKWTVP